MHDSITQNSMFSRILLEQVLDGIITIDQSGIVQTFNQAAERIFGYSGAEVIGNNVRMLMPEPYSSQHDQYIQNYLTTGDAKIIGIGREVVGLRKNGSQFPLELGITAIEVDGKQIFSGIVRDISQRKQTEKELLSEKARTQAILENVVDGIITINQKGIVQSFNRAAEKIFGYTADEIIGTNVSILMPEPYSRQHNQYVQNYLDTGNAKIIGIGREVIGLRKDGTQFPLELGITQMETENELLFIGITRDITNQKHSEDAREQLASIVENTEDAIWGQELDGTLTLWNNAARKIFGYSEIEIVGKPTSQLVPVERKAEGSYILEKIKRGETLNNFETQRQRKDGKKIDVSLTVSPIRDQHANITGASTISRDISGQVMLLKEKEELIRRLEEITIQDPLTQLLNRRGMMQRLEYELARYHRFARPFTLLLGDIDFFKKINDTLGHEAGDIALKYLANLLRGACRAQDSICRWGGEEFLILLPETSQEGGVQFAEKLKSIIQFKPITYLGKNIELTMSFGLVTPSSTQDISIAHLLQQADAKLYQAKNGGRNQVVVELEGQP